MTLLAISISWSVGNFSVLNWTSWCKLRWESCCPFKESDAGILNLILSPREPQSELALLRGSRFIASATLLIAHVHISICLGSPIFGHPTLWEGLTHDYLWIACFLEICLNLWVKDKNYRLQQKGDEKIHPQQFFLEIQFIISCFDCQADQHAGEQNLTIHMRC